MMRELTPGVLDLYSARIQITIELIKAKACPGYLTIYGECIPTDKNPYKDKFQEKRRLEDIKKENCPK